MSTSNKFGSVSSQVPAPLAVPSDVEVTKYIEAQSQQRPAEVPNLIQASMIFNGRIKPAVKRHEDLTQKATTELEGEVVRREAELQAIRDQKPSLEQAANDLENRLTSLNSQFVATTAQAGLMTEGNHPKDVKQSIAGAIGIKLPEQQEQPAEEEAAEKAPSKIMLILSYILEGLLFIAPGIVFSVTLGLMIGFLDYRDVQDGLLLSPKIVVMFITGVVLIYTIGLIITHLTERTIRDKEATPDQWQRASFPLYIGWAVVTLFWIAEVTIEANGLHLLYLQRAASIARKGAEAEILSMPMFYLFGIIISTGYFFLKMVKSAKKASAEQDVEWRRYRHQHEVAEYQAAELEATVKMTDFLRNCPPAAEALRLSNEIEGADQQLTEITNEVETLIERQDELEKPIELSEGLRNALKDAEREALQAMADFDAKAGANLFTEAMEKISIA